MITNTAVASFDGPKKSHIFPPDDYLVGDEGITARQKQLLTDLIFQKCDEEEREHFLSQMDDMTSTDAEDMIFSFLTSRWR